MNTPRRVPDLFVEQLAAGELSPERAQEVRRRLEAEPGGLERLAEISTSNITIREVLPADGVAREVRARVAEADFRPAASSARWWVPLLTVAAAMMLVVVIPRGVQTPDETPGVRTKGLSTSLGIFRKRGADKAVLGVNDAARDGDVLQLTYVAVDDRYGVILSVDGRGVVSLHHPSSPNASAELTTDGEVALDHAYELDDAPEHETFVFISSPAPISVTDILDRARADGLDAVYTDLDGRPLRPVIRRVPKEHR